MNPQGLSTISPSYPPCKISSRPPAAAELCGMVPGFRGSGENGDEGRRVWPPSGDTLGSWPWPWPWGITPWPKGKWFPSTNG
jgi:hypothetical protein